MIALKEGESQGKLHKNYKIDSIHQPKRLEVKKITNMHEILVL